MRLQELQDRLNAGRVVAGAAVEARGITHDSRAVRPGDLFVCLIGGAHDGHAYAGDALARGAAAVVAMEGRPLTVPAETPLLVVPDTRRALPELASALFGDPSRDLILVGITGTNGKTTTTFLVASILRAAGLRTGTIGTLGADVDGESLPSAHTTPEADQLQALLASMRDLGARAVAMEVSSHALAQFRTDGCAYDAAAFTNLTQDHLDFHGSMDSYFEAKLRLFREYPARSDKPFVASVNLDDPRGEAVCRETRGRTVTYAVRGAADVVATDIRIEPASLAFRAQTPAGAFEAALRIGGAFQVYNALAAIGIGIGLGLPVEVIRDGLAALPAVPGRFEAVPTGRGYHVVVDYAHTPDGLENVLRAARSLNPARLLVVFGCGGNRDRTKRPIMGRMAATMADVAIVTSDNPRREDPNAIIEDIKPGMEGGSAQTLVEPDRRAAIALALGAARDGDLVVIAGKGHEDYQIVGDRTYPFDDRQVVRELLADG